MVVVILVVVVETAIIVIAAAVVVIIGYMDRSIEYLPGTHWLIVIRRWDDDDGSKAGKN